MGIDAKKIQAFLLMITKFSFNICSRFVQKHPLISSVLVFLFILYFFLPKAFFFLIYASPFLACTYVFIRFYWHSQKPKTEKDHEKKIDAAVRGKLRKKDGKSVRRTYTSDRNSEGKNSKNPEDDPVRIEQKQREITEEKKDFPSGSRDVSVADITSQTRIEDSIRKPDGGGKTEIESLSSEEDEAKQGRIKAVEWTEDDQKNLMDLGLSELERNKRLESLIARRRARKLYKMQTDKYLFGNINACGSIPVAPVSITRSHTFDVPYAPYDQIPGSAPSILLQNRNPFDIPYDPFEEKPNLMADSFHQEFMEAHQREMMFCRHESFSLGPSFPFQGKLNENNIAGQPRFTRQIGKGQPDWLVGHSQVQEEDFISRTLSVTDLVTQKNETSHEVNIQPEEEKEMENIGTESSISKENDTKMGMIHEIKHKKRESSSSSLSEDNEAATRGKKTTGLTNIKPPVFRFPDTVISPNQNSAPCPLPKARALNEVSYIASPSTIDRSSLENHLLYTNNGPWHAPSDSIGSDMQVEVSEVGSPPLTGDGSASSNDGDSLTYDGDIEKEITSGSDEMWGVSPHAPKVEHDQTLSEANEFDGDNIPREFPGFQQELQDPIPSSVGIHLPQQDQNLSVNSDHKVSNDGEQVANELQDSNPPESSMEGTSLLDSSISSTPPPEEHLKKPQESMNSPEKVVGDRHSVEVTPNVPETSTVPELARDFSEPVDEINSESSNHIESKSPNYPEQAVEKVSIAYTVDVPVCKNDYIGDQESVEITHGITENSIISEVAQEHIDEINLESGNMIESKSPKSPEQSEDEVIRALTADVHVHTNDDLRDQNLVEVTHSVPETSITSEVAHDPLEPTDQINSESSNQIESESPKSPEQSMDEVIITHPTDVPVHMNDDLGDQNSIGVTHGMPEMSVTLEVARDLLEPTDEINSESSNQIESKSPKSPEQSIDEVIITHPEDVHVHANDDQGDQNSVEFTHSVPETSISSEVAHDLLEPADEINLESCNQIENKSPHSPEQTMEEVSIAQAEDVPVHTFDDLEDQKSAEVTAGVPETSIISEVAHDLKQSAEEIDSECSNFIEGKPLSSLREVSIADVADVPIHTNNDLGDQNLVEVTSSVPETSIISNERSLESSNQIESKSPNSPEQPVEEVSITYTADGPVNTYNDLGDQNSDKVTQNVPETSIISNERNSEGGNQTEDESPNFPEQPLEEVNIDYTVDVPDQKSVEDMSHAPERSIISEVSDNLSELAEEINSYNSRHVEHNSLNALEQSVEEANNASSINDPVVDMNDGKSRESIEQEVQDLLKTDLDSPREIAEEASSVDNVTQQVDLSDLSKRAEQETSDVGQNNERDYDKSPDDQAIVDLAMPTTEDETSNESKDILMPTEDGEKEQSIREFEVSEMNPNPDDPSASGIQQELTIDQESADSISSSSPKSVLPDQVAFSPTTLDLNQHLHTDFSESGALDESKQPTYEEERADSDISELIVQEEVGEGNSGAKYAEGEHDNLTKDKNVGSPSKPAEETDQITVGEETLLQNSATIQDTITDDINIKEDQDHRMEAIKDTESESRNLTEDEIENPPEEMNNSNDIKDMSKDGTEGDEIKNNTIIDEAEAPKSEAA